MLNSEAIQYTSEQVLGQGFDLELIPNVIANTLDDNWEGDGDDTATLLTAQKAINGIQYVTTIAVLEENLELPNKRKEIAIQQITAAFDKIEMERSNDLEGKAS